MILLNALLVSLAINCLLFLVAFRLQTDKLTDLSYSLSFVVVSLYGFFVTSHAPSMAVLVAMVLIWAARLGSFLVLRIRKIGRDRRFDGRREHFWRFGSFWLAQAVSVPIILLPTLLSFENHYSGTSPGMLLGIVVWFAGLCIESIADYQKYRFKLHPQNRGKWIDSGLWSYSRHPNYLGEILVWAGIYIFAASQLTVFASLVALIGPIYITTLLRYVSGVPLLEAAADKNWGNLDRYQTYRRRTGIILPRFPR